MPKEPEMPEAIREVCRRSAAVTLEGLATPVDELGGVSAITINDHDAAVRLLSAAFEVVVTQVMLKTRKVITGTRTLFTANNVASLGRMSVSTELYQRCPLCNGTLRTVSHAMVDGYRPTDEAEWQRLVCAGYGGIYGGKYSGQLPAGSLCPCHTSETPGFSPVGLTLEQVEKMQSQLRSNLLKEGGTDAQSQG